MFLCFLLVTNKIDEVWQRYLGEGSSERDEILQVARGGLVYPPPRPVTFVPGDPLGSQNIEGCKKFRTRGDIIVTIEEFIVHLLQKQ